MFSIENRRYVGNKFQLTGWIRNIILAECSGCSSFFDVFAGTGSVSASMLDSFDVFYLNDFLFSNETVYKAFFGKGKKGIYHIQHINSYHSNLKKFMRKFNGVSTKYLNNYLIWNNILNYSKETWTEKKNIFTDFVFTTEKKVLCKDIRNRSAIPLLG